MARLFDLSSSWLLPAASSDVWAVIAHPDINWHLWWPGCSQPRPTEHETCSPGLMGTTAHLAFSAALGYRLALELRTTGTDDSRWVEFSADGDLRGTGSAVLREEPGGTRLDIDWRVEPSKRWMRMLSPVAAPAFILAHRLLMAQGERGLRAELARRSSTDPAPLQHRDEVDADPIWSGRDGLR